VLRKIGGLALDQVTNQAIADLLRRMQDIGYARGTTNRVLVLLRYMFNLAIKWGCLAPRKIRPQG
jgi:site-specific recombinase XerD